MFNFRSSKWERLPAHQGIWSDFYYPTHTQYGNDYADISMSEYCNRYQISFESILNTSVCEDDYKLIRMQTSLGNLKRALGL